MKYSVVIPIFNESDSLKILWKELVVVMNKLEPDWETIFINDGSTDTSLEILNSLAVRNKSIKVINFHKNQGKAAALQAGFQASQGEVVITLDADLQDDPKEIPKLMVTLNQGYDLVSGHKKNRHDPLSKTIPSYFFNALIRQTSGVQLHDINSGFKVYRRNVVKKLSIYGELYRFIPLLAVNEGFKVTETVVNHRQRQFGKSKYGASRMLRGFLDLFTMAFLTKFIKRPLHLFGTIGLMFLMLGIGISIYMTYLHFVLSQSVGDRPLLLFGILFIIAGIQLLSTGLIAELITYYAHMLGYQREIEILPQDTIISSRK